MYACAYINIGILISTYVHMHTNGRRNMLFFPIFSNDFSRWRQAKEEESASHFRMPCAADERSARFGTMRAFHIADMKNPWTNFVYHFLSWWPDLNWWPHPYQGCALPPEPHQHIFGGSGGIRTPVGFHPNGFQDRLVMTASIRFHIKSKHIVSFVFWNRFLSNRFDV